MSLTLSKIAQNTASVTLQYSILHEDGSRESLPVTITYYPGRVTEKTVAAFSAFTDMDQAGMAAGFATFNEMLVHLIKSWDVLDDSVEPPVMFPLDAARFADLPLDFRIQVTGAIMGDIRPETIAPQMQNARA